MEETGEMSYDDEILDCWNRKLVKIWSIWNFLQINANYTMINANMELNIILNIYLIIQLDVFIHVNL